MASSDFHYPHDSHAAAPSPRLLAVDDEPSTRAYLRELLSKHYTVEVVADAESALRAIRRGPLPDLLLSDVIMRGVDGLGLLRTLRADPATALLPVLLITGCDDEETRLRGFELGADDYINKPIRAREILARVRTHLDLARLRRYEGIPTPPADDDRFRAIVNQAMAGVAELDAEGRYTMVNQKFCEMLGYRREELIGRSRFDAIHPDDLPECRRGFERLLATGEPHSAEKRLIRRDGAVIWVNDCDSLIPGDALLPPRVVMVAIDITGRKQTEEFLRRSDEHFRLVVDSARDYVIFSLDPQGRIATWNDGGTRLKGYLPEEIIGRHVSVFSTPEDRAAGAAERLMAEALACGRAVSESWRVRKDGTRFWGEETLFPMRGPGGEILGFAKICRDLTERKAADDTRARLHAAEQAARLHAEAANAAKDRFLAVLSHELRTPLTPVHLALSLLRREPNLSAAARESVEMIARNVDAEVRLIDDLLDVSSIIHGKVELAQNHVRLHECVQRAAEFCHAEIAAKTQTLDLALEATADEVRGDAERLRQAFSNLLQNAVKFTPENGRISVRSREAEGWIVVEVQDTGMGVEAEMLPKLFDVFEQGGPEVTREYGGLGLGLSISHAIIQGHGGQLTVASGGTGQGTTFTVSLPRPTAATG